MKSAIRLFSILFFITTFLWMAKAILLTNFPDFNNFYLSPGLIFNGVNPYLDKDTLFTSQTYPPHVFIFVYPLQFLPLFAMSKIWTLGSIASLLASIFILLKLYKEKITSNTALVLSGLVFLSFPVKFSLGMGQINIYILLLITLFIFYFKKNEVLSGVFLFFSLALKIFPVFIPVYLLFLRKWKTLLTIIILGFALLTISYTVFGYQMMNYFIFDIFPTLLGGWKGDYYNQSLSGFLFRTGLELNILETVRLVISSLLFFITFYIVLKNNATDIFNLNLKFGAILTLNVIINNFSWQHHFVWLIPSFFFIFFYLRKIKASKYLFITLALSYFLVAFNIKNPAGYPMFLHSHVFWGAFLLLILNLYLLLPDNFKEKVNFLSPVK
jgi:hypothetical protein